MSDMTASPYDRLSYAARGLLQRLTALDPETASIRPEEHVTAKNRVDSVKTLLTELETEGFLRRWRQVSERGADGRVAGGPRLAWQLYPDGNAPTTE